MSTSTFILCLAVGGALLALWLHVRFPRLGDSGWRRVLVHLAFALVVVQAVMPAALRGAVAHEAPGTSVVAALGLVLPAFTYVFLSSIWFLRLAQGLLGGTHR